MQRSLALRLALPAILAATLLPAAVYAQSESSQSVAEAARRAREQKKAATKPVKVVTEDDVKPASSDAAGAAAQPAAAAQPNSTGAQAPANSAEAEKAAKERTALKQQIKQAMSDLDTLQRAYQLDQDSYYSKVDYAKDTAGKDKLDAQKQQISDKQQELDRLKAQLAALPDSPDSSATTPPKP